MRRRTVAKTIGVEREVSRLEAHVAQVLLENIDPMLSLAAAGHLVAPVIEVKPTTQLTS
tara:strand:+ start:426 stop:602 length:177 start_codon:yes stop_codon:yes gene_type:complete